MCTKEKGRDGEEERENVRVSASISAFIGSKWMNVVVVLVVLVVVIIDTVCVRVFFLPSARLTVINYWSFRHFRISPRLFSTSLSISVQMMPLCACDLPCLDIFAFSLLHFFHSFNFVFILFCFVLFCSVIWTDGL